MFDKLKEMAGGADALGKILSGDDLLKQGASGDAVKLVQQALAGGGFDVGAIDGIFGPQTKAAVEMLQGKFGLDTDGIVGPQTAEKIKDVLANLGGGDGVADLAGKAFSAFTK